MNRYTRVIAVPAVIGGVGMALLNCGGSHSSASADRAQVSAFATSAQVKADETRAQAIIRPCIATGHIATAKACLEKAVPKSERSALGTCLAEAGLKGWESLKTTGAQACLMTTVVAVPVIPGATQPAQLGVSATHG